MFAYSLVINAYQQILCKQFLNKIMETGLCITIILPDICNLHCLFICLFECMYFLWRLPLSHLKVYALDYRASLSTSSGFHQEVALECFPSPVSASILCDSRPETIARLFKDGE